MSGRCPDCRADFALTAKGTLPAHRDRRERDPFLRDFKNRPMTMRFNEQGKCEGGGKTPPEVVAWHKERGLPV